MPWAELTSHILPKWHTYHPWQQARPRRRPPTWPVTHLSAQSHLFIPKPSKSGPKISNRGRTVKQSLPRNPPASQIPALPRAQQRPPRRAPPSPSTPLAAPTRTSAWVSRRSPSRHLRPRRPPKRRGRSGGSCTCPTCPGPSPRRRSRSSSRSSAPSRASR
jgi:hypothetical protein